MKLLKRLAFMRIAVLSVAFAGVSAALGLAAETQLTYAEILKRCEGRVLQNELGDPCGMIVLDVAMELDGTMEEGTNLCLSSERVQKAAEDLVAATRKNPDSIEYTDELVRSIVKAALSCQDSDPE